MNTKQMTIKEMFVEALKSTYFAFKYKTTGLLQCDTGNKLKALFNISGNMMILLRVG